MMSLVNDDNLPIFFVDENNVRSFFSAKTSLIFSTKNKSVFGHKVIKHSTRLPVKELVNLTML